MNEWVYYVDGPKDGQTLLGKHDHDGFLVFDGKRPWAFYKLNGEGFTAKDGQRVQVAVYIGEHPPARSSEPSPCSRVDLPWEVVPVPEQRSTTMASNFKVNPEGMRRLEREVSAKTRPIFARAQAAADAAPAGRRSEAYAKAMKAGGLQPDMKELRKLFGE